MAQKFEAKLAHEIDSRDDLNLETLEEIKRILCGEKMSDLTFVILHFNHYCQLKSDLYLPAEVGLVAFSVKEKIIDSYSSLIDPGKIQTESIILCHIPFGSYAAVQARCDKIGLSVPGFDVKYQTFDHILGKIEKFVQTHAAKDNDKLPIFCMRNDLESHNGCFKWMYENASETQDCEMPKKIVLKPLELLIHLMGQKGYNYRNSRSDGTSVIPSWDVMDLTDRLVTSLGLGSFPKMVSPLHAHIAAEEGNRRDSEQFLLRLGKFYNELHAEEFLATCANDHKATLACEHHRKTENEVGLSSCSSFITKQLARSIYESLGFLLNYN